VDASEFEPAHPGEEVPRLGFPDEAAPGEQRGRAAAAEPQQQYAAAAPLASPRRSARPRRRAGGGAAAPAAATDAEAAARADALPPLTVVALSRLVYRKGVDLLALVIPEVCARHPNVRFVIGARGGVGWGGGAAEWGGVGQCGVGEAVKRWALLAAVAPSPMPLPPPLRPAPQAATAPSAACWRRSWRAAALRAALRSSARCPTSARARCCCRARCGRPWAA
jgi:hypothetical protein